MICNLKCNFFYEFQNGLFYNVNEGGTADVSTSPGSGGSSIADELADLRRQVVFLQGQVEDRDRTIQVLQVWSFVESIFLIKR